MSNENTTITSDGQGILVGVQPANPVQTTNAAWEAQNARPNEFVSQQQPTQQQPQQPTGRHFTEEDIEKARQQEKDKLYGRIEELSSGLKTMQEERQAEQAERQRLQEEAEVARRSKEESEMEVRDLMARRDAEWEARFAEQDRRYEADRAVFEQERRRVEVFNYMRDRIEQEQENILPELREFVTGSTPEEIDQSIEMLKARSESILNNVAAAQQPQLRPTVMPSVPPVGPMEQLPSYEQITPEQIAGMDMKTYERYRDQLLRATNPNQRRGR